MAAILSFLATSLGKIFADKIMGMLALKVILTFLFIIVLPILFNNFLYDIFEIMMNFASSQSGQASSLNGAMNFSGFAAWLIECFRLAECLSVLIGALSLRVVLSMIPFIKMV